MFIERKKAWFVQINNELCQKWKWHDIRDSTKHIKYIPHNSINHNNKIIQQTLMSSVLNIVLQRQFKKKRKETWQWSPNNDHIFIDWYFVDISTLKTTTLSINHPFSNNYHPSTIQTNQNTQFHFNLLWMFNLLGHLFIVHKKMKFGCRFVVWDYYLTSILVFLISDWKLIIKLMKILFDCWTMDSFKSEFHCFYFLSFKKLFFWGYFRSCFDLWAAIRF